jgi:hypothetical protein
VFFSIFIKKYWMFFFFFQCTECFSSFIKNTEYLSSFIKNIECFFLLLSKYRIFFFSCRYVFFYVMVQRDQYDIFKNMLAPREYNTQCSIVCLNVESNMILRTSS